jgi:hypothetical protein
LPPPFSVVSIDTASSYAPFTCEWQEVKVWRTIEEAERIGFEEVARYGFPHFGTALKSREVSFMCGDRWVITLRC